MDFPITPEFWWSVDILSSSIFLQGVDQEILPCVKGKIDMTVSYMQKTRVSGDNISANFLDVIGFSAKFRDFIRIFKKALSATKVLFFMYGSAGIFKPRQMLKCLEIVERRKRWRQIFSNGMSKILLSQTFEKSEEKKV